MSPWASASLIRTVVAAERCSTAPPSSSGTPTMVRPSSPAWLSSSAGAAHASSAFRAAGRSRSSANSRTELRSMCCSSEGSRSKRSLRGARGWRAGRDRRWAAANVRPARAAVRPVVLLAPCRRRTAGSRRPRRSMAEEEATLLMARRPIAMLFSAILVSVGMAKDGITICCYISRCNAERRCSVKLSTAPLARAVLIRPWPRTGADSPRAARVPRRSYAFMKDGLHSHDGLLHTLVSCRVGVVTTEESEGGGRTSPRLVPLTVTLRRPSATANVRLAVRGRGDSPRLAVPAAVQAMTPAWACPPGRGNIDAHRAAAEPRGRRDRAREASAATR